MKAALNGVPSLSVVGWVVGRGLYRRRHGVGDRRRRRAPKTHGKALLDKLEGIGAAAVLWRSRQGARVMKSAISKVRAVFTSHRTMRRYAAEAYLSCGGG